MCGPSSANRKLREQYALVGLDVDVGDFNWFFDVDIRHLKAFCYTTLILLGVNELEAKFPETAKKYINPVITFLTISALVLIYGGIYLKYFQINQNSPGGYRNAQLMMEIYKNHLGEVLYHNAFKPPLTFVFPGMVAKLFSLETIREYLLIDVQNIVINFFGSLAAFRTFLLVTRSHVLSGTLALLYTAVAVTFYTRFGNPTHWDVVVVPLLMIFFYALANMVYNPSKRSATMAGLAAIAVYGHSSIGLIVYAATIPFVALVFIQLREIPYAVRYIVVPCLVAFLWLSKNYAINGNFSPSVLGGGNQMRALLHTGHGADVRKIVHDQAPSWYRTCYDNPVPPKGGTRAWADIARSFGICYSWAKPTDRTYSTYSNPPHPWPFDMTEFYAQIKALPDVPPEILSGIEHDIDIMKNRPYIFAGSIENSGAWQAAYAQESTRLYKEFVKRHPDKFLSAIKDIHNNYFFSNRMFYLGSAVNDDLNYRGLLQKGISAYRGFGLLSYRLMFIIALILVLGIAPILYYRIWRFSGFLYGSAAIACGLSAVAVLISASCCENDRYFVHITPMIFIAYAYGWTLLRDLGRLGNFGAKFSSNFERGTIIETT